MDIGCILTIGETIEDRQKEINFLNTKLKEYCNQLNVDDVRSLNYSEIKKLYLVAGDYLSDDIKKIYEYIIKGVTIKPFFQVVATDDEYEDSYSILGSDDGQEALKSLIEMLE